MALRVVAVVQARMGSTRLPGKVLCDIGGHTMLERVVVRLRRSARLDEVVVATSILVQDDAIAAYGAILGATVVRGDALDVLARYALAVRLTNADVVVRITADCPFIDPDLVDEVVDALIAGDGGIDYSSNTIEPRHFPRGLDVEAMTSAALLEANDLDRDPGTREHVTPFIRESGRYRAAAVTQREDMSRVRWTVDTEEDLEVARLLAEALDGGLDSSWGELLDAWRRHPEWHEINAGIEQKEVEHLLE